jgi:hypothetical protein
MSVTTLPALAMPTGSVSRLFSYFMIDSCFCDKNKELSPEFTASLYNGYFTLLYFI